MKTFAIIVISLLFISCAVKSSEWQATERRMDDMAQQITILQAEVDELERKIELLESRPPPVFRFAPMPSKKREPEIEEPEPPPPPPKPREHVETEKILVKKLQEVGLSCKVIIKDTNGNNVPDFWIKCRENVIIEDQLALVYMTGIIAVITNRIDWKSDMIYFMLREDYAYVATTRDCKKCDNEIAKRNNMPLEQELVIYGCIMKIWTMETMNY